MKKTLRPRTLVVAALACTLILTATIQLKAQTPSRFIGSITATGDSTLTVKTDAGQQYQVAVPEATDIKRISPGEHDLSKAEALPFAGLAVGDRVLVKLDPNAPAGTTQALQIIAIKQADVAQKQEEEREAWQKNGVGGLVKSVDAATGTIVVTSGAGATMKTVTVHTTDKTVLKRYAPGSVKFADAKPAPLSEIQAGDQLRARGQKNADGTEMTADAIVSGSFRNISGVVSAIDPSAGTFVVKDLVTKKNVTIHVPPTAQMKRLPEMMAKMLAAALKGGGQGSGQAGAWQQGGGQAPAGQAGGGQPGGAPGGAGRWRSQGRGGDLQQVLNRAPSISIADLKKGDAVMLVSTQGTEEVIAITLLAGVEPLLEAPAESQNLLSNWSMSTSGGGDTATQ
jgi:Domain of unknown function (DUF5666)